MQLGFVTLIIAHVTFCTPYVILNVLPKLRQMDRFTFEAAQDLGCSPKLAFYKVVIPEIMPGMVSGFLMAFTYSLDDFVISYFESSNGKQKDNHHQCQKEGKDTLFHAAGSSFRIICFSLRAE